MNCYLIKPVSSYKIIRKCGGCGCKTSYVNTGNFRVNANGNKLDVWLIYQCEKCKHSYNLSIYERVAPKFIPVEEYKGFLRNDEELSLRVGTDRSVFARNQAEIVPENNYIIEDINEAAENLIFYNPYRLKIRDDKLLHDVLHESRSGIKDKIKNGIINKVTGDDDIIRYIF